MPIDKRVDFAAALDGVADGATVFISGFGARASRTHSFTRCASAAQKTSLWWSIRQRTVIRSPMS